EGCSMSARTVHDDVLAQRSRDARQGRRVRAFMLVAAVLYVGILLLAPLAGIVWSALRGGFGLVASTLAQHDVVHAFLLTALVTVFVSIPFVIREVAPVLEELGLEEEQAAWTLGASRLQTFFRVTLPNVRWGLLYGIALSTARALGEVGAVLIVSGLIQGQTETATLYIYRAFEQNQYTQGYVVALVLALVSIVL